MPKIVIQPSQLATMRALIHSGWTHDRVAKLFNVGRSTLTHALQRKTRLPSQIEDETGRTASDVLVRVTNAANRAMAKELRAIADKMETST